MNQLRCRLGAHLCPCVWQRSAGKGNRKFMAVSQGSDPDKCKVECAAAMPNYFRHCLVKSLSLGVSVDVFKTLPWKVGHAEFLKVSFQTRGQGPYFLPFSYANAESQYNIRCHFARKRRESRKLFLSVTLKVKVAHTRLPSVYVPELILVLGSQPAGDVSHKPGGRLPLLSARPAVIDQSTTNFISDKQAIKQQ